MEYNLLGKSAQYRLPLNVAYTYNDAQFQETFVNAGGDWGIGKINKGEQIPFITPHLLTASLAFEAEKFNVTLTGRYTGKTRIKTGGDMDIVPTETTKYNDINSLESFLVIDLSANYSINKYLAIFSSVNNLFNNRYIVANLPQGFRPGMPFSANVGAKVNF
jgi:Fe(3+) dicitrate transport protein